MDELIHELAARFPDRSFKVEKILWYFNHTKEFVLCHSLSVLPGFDGGGSQIFGDDVNNAKSLPDLLSELNAAADAANNEKARVS